MVKFLAIINKNVKVVSRSWIYVVLLLILPTLLVGISGMLLDSVDEKNVRVGIIRSPQMSALEIDGIRNRFPGGLFVDYSSFIECEEALKSHSIPVCINPIRTYNETSIDIYFDNSNLLVSQYAKNYVTKKVVTEQLVIFEVTLREVLTKMGSLAESVKDAQLELENAYKELVDQEDKILTYQNNFSQLETSFNRVYSDMKYYHPLIQENIETLKEVKKYLGDNLTEFNQQAQNLRIQIPYVKQLLKPSLPQDAYDQISSKLDGILATVDILEKDLSTLNTKLYYENPDTMLRDYNNAIATLDQTKSMLEQINTEMNAGIVLINKNKERAQSILFQIEENKAELEKLYSKINSTSNYKIALKDAFSIRQQTSSIFFPLIFILIIAFTSIILSNIIVIEQTHKPSYIREAITPTYDITFLFGDFIISLFVSLFQIAILFLVGSFWFGLYIFNNFFYLFSISIIVSSIFILIGMSMGYLIRSRHISILVSTFILLFFIVLSELFIPRQLTGILVKFLTALNPFVIANKLAFDTMIFSKTIQYAAFYIIYLVFLLIFTFFFAYICKKIGKYKITKE